MVTLLVPDRFYAEMEIPGFDSHLIHGMKGQWDI